MKLHEILKERIELSAQREKIIKGHSENMKIIDSEIAELTRLESLAIEGNDLEKCLMAEKILTFKGKPDNVCEGRRLTDVAAIDIAMGHPHLAKQTFANKQYESFYQQCDSEYGMGPRHGHIVDAIGMKEESRGQVLCDQEKDACIYYLKNYSKIKAATKQPA